MGLDRLRIVLAVVIVAEWIGSPYMEHWFGVVQPSGLDTVMLIVAGWLFSGGVISCLKKRQNGEEP